MRGEAIGWAFRFQEQALALFMAMGWLTSSSEPI